ncbi:MAG: FAD-dependent oxidoreductase, partial [Bacteroidales bacterium]
VLPLLSTHAINKQNNMTRTLHGIGGEILQRLQEIGMAIKEINPTIDPEATKYVLEVMLKESGVMPLYHCWASNVIVESNTIKAVLLETKSGRVAISPKVVIDCTGDGDILHLAGEEYDIMNYELGLVHRLGNIDRINKDAAGYRDLNIGGETPIPSVNWVNMVGGDYEDALDFRRLSELQQQHRIEIWEGVQQIRSVPGYEEVFLLDTAAQQGVRMSRILKGGYRLTLEDSMTFKSFDDNIGISGAWTSLLYQSKRVKMNERPMWQIPYRALLPQKTKNLLVAGRCFSFEQDLFQDARIIGTCLVTGHGAGVGAALASNTGNSVQELDVKEIQKVLLEQKVFLG